MHPNLDSGAIRADAARRIALAVFGNTCAGAIGIAKSSLTVENGHLVALDRGRRAHTLDGEGHVVPWTAADLIESLRARYFSLDVFTHRELAAIVGLRNGQLAAMLRDGVGPVDPHEDRRGAYYTIAPENLQAWIAANQTAIGRYRAYDSLAAGRRHRRARGEA